MNLTKLSLKRPVSVLIVILALVVFGLASIASAPVELTPDIEVPMLIVATVYPGAGPEDVEDLVSKKVESAVSTLGGIKNIQSNSQENMSMVMLELEYGTDMNLAHMDLQEKLNTAINSLPEEASTPIIVEMKMDSMPTVTMSATATGDIELLNYITDEVVPEFEKLSGVASVSVYGGQEDYISVELQEEKLGQYGLDMSAIINYVSTADFSIPVGTAELGSQSMAVRSGVGYDTAESLKNVPLFLRSGDVIHLSDVAEVRKSTKPVDSISRYNGSDNITLSITKRQSASTVDVSTDVIAALAKVNAKDAGILLEVVSDSSEMILDSVQSVISTLLLGIVLSMIVLFLFFGDWKASLIVGSSMPISLLATFIAMKMMGFSLNLVSLGGLVIGVGMMVDNSIVVIESCFRQKSDQLGFREAALEGTKFVTSSIIASTITTVVVFLPISVMQGISGQMFKQLGFTIIFSLLSSLISALTLVPLFYSRFKPMERGEAPVSRLVHRTEIAYGNLLTKILRYKKTVVAIAVALLVASVGLFSLLNMELMPAMDEGAVAISVETRPGLELAQIDKIMTQMEQMVAQHPDVGDYSLTAGGTSIFGSSSSSLTAYLRDGHTMSTDEVVEQWRRETNAMVGCDVNITASGGSSAAMMGSSDIAVRLEGNNLETLRSSSRLVEDMMRATPGIVRVTSDVSAGDPQAEIVIDPLKASAAGFTPMQLAGMLNSTLSGKEASALREDGREYKVWVEFPSGRYETMAQLSGLVLTSPSGKQVPLMDVASIQYTDSPQVITRLNNQYVVSITAQPTEAAKFAAQEQIMKDAEAIQFPEGVSMYQGASMESMNEEFSALGNAIMIAVLLVFMVMAMQFESPRFSLLVMLCVPFSLIGSFGLMFLTGSTVSMISLMGLLTLIGTVVNNGILFIDTTNQLRASMDMETALVSAGRMRLRPILMTTLTTVLSMIPLAIGLGSGAEMMRGMAVIIIGGLCASTVLTLLLLPTFYILMNRSKEKRQRKKLEKGPREGSQQGHLFPDAPDLSLPDGLPPLPLEGEEQITTT